MADCSDGRNALHRRVRELVVHPQLREFVLQALDRAPDYIWQINASTSGKHHRGETQTEHVLRALALAEHLAEAMEHPAFQPFFPPEGPSLLYAVVVLHDLYKCGLPGQERRRPDGGLATDPLHPLYPPQALKDLKVWDQEKGTEVEVCACPWWKSFCEGVVGHMGPWTPEPAARFLLSEGLGSFALLAFLCDYLASRRGVEVVR